MKMIQTLRALCWAAILAAAGTTAQTQTAVDLPVSQARVLAVQTLLSGDAAGALQIAQAILAINPDDRDALIVVAAAAPQVGDARLGRQAGVRAWRVSVTDEQKYEAARLTALAATGEERFTLSTFWLRRALTVVPNDAERSRTLQDARIVTQRNPWATQLSFSLVPSNNINGGAEDPASTAPGNPDGTLSEDSLALEGWRGTLNFSTQYRLRESARSRTTIGLQYQIARVLLTDADSVPDDAFDTDTTTLVLRHDQAFENSTLSFNASRGVTTYRENLDLDTGDSNFAKYDLWSLGLDWQVPLQERLLLTLSVGREWLLYSSRGIGEVDRHILRTGLSYQRANNDRVNGFLTFTDNVGDSVNYTSQDKIISASYSFAQPLDLNGPITVSLGGGIRWSDYPKYRLFFPVAGGREDFTVFANMNLGFPQIEYAGFSPGLRLDVSQADSNVSRFERNSYAIALTLNSVF